MNDDAIQLNQRDPDDALDRVLRTELHWEAPAELTSRLLDLIPVAPALLVTPAASPPPRPQRWYTNLVIILTALAIGLSFAVAWEFYGALSEGIGLGALWSQIQQAMMLGLQRLYQALPVARYVVALLVGIRDQLHWLLLAAVLWLALDGWSPRLPIRRQQTS